MIHLPLIAGNETDTVLDSIEVNNIRLQTLRKTVEVQQAENRAENYLADPEIGFNYLWGNPAAIGTRADFSVSQSFDIPTVTGMKSRMVKGKNELAEWQYKADRMNILLQAKQYCIDLIYYNALRKELATRLEHSETIENIYKKRFESGDTGILEYNKARMDHAFVLGELSRVDTERELIRTQLKQLNGGKAVILNNDVFSRPEMLLNFEDWYADAEQKNPVLAYVRQEVEVSRKQLDISKASALPSFSAGYMSEKVVGEQYRGISVGISVPLWSARNKIRQAKAASRVAELKETDSRMQFYSSVQALYTRVSGLGNMAKTYRKALETANNTDLLRKALEAGEISALEYFVEIKTCYEAVNLALEAEKDYYKALAELTAVEL